MESAVSLVRYVGAGHLRGLLLGTAVECGLVQGTGVHVIEVCGGHIWIGFLVGSCELGQGIRHLENTDPGGHK